MAKRKDLLCDPPRNLARQQGATSSASVSDRNLVEYPTRNVDWVRLLRLLQVLYSRQAAQSPQPSDLPSGTRIDNDAQRQGAAALLEDLLKNARLQDQTSFVRSVQGILSTSQKA